MKLQKESLQAAWLQAFMVAFLGHIQGVFLFLNKKKQRKKATLSWSYVHGFVSKSNGHKEGE